MSAPQLKASNLEPQIVEFRDFVTGDPVIGIRIPEFITRDGTAEEDHVLAAFQKLYIRLEEIECKILRSKRLRSGS